MLVDYTNRYAALHNREGDIQPNEMRCFFAILLLSGYTSVSRREMYWENALDSNNPLVCNAMSRNRFRFIMQNIHCNDNNVLPTSQVKRFSQKEKKSIYVQQPNLIKKYNLNMGGIDRADENIRYQYVEKMVLSTHQSLS
ncbi:hypothetical protein C0J52_15047 [Blattella germanica]|nr:hypothetical protein C0J52_15047 [Blattella germanica]